MKQVWIVLAATMCLLACQRGHAQSLEDQLRAQLAEARSQLQDLQGQQAQWQTQQAQLQKERDDARKALDDSKASVGTLQASAAHDATALAAERRAHEQDQASLQELKKQLAAADARAHTQQQQAGDLGSQLSQAQGRVNTCTAKNQRLYQIGGEILDAYSHMTVGKALASREPFAAAERVKLDNAAQAYGDQLYEQRYDPRASAPKKP